MAYRKKLIEVALPLEAINAESAREKSIRHGHPSTLHLWWARRPLATARAVIWSSLVDDPSSHPEIFPTEEAQNAERQRLFDILEQLVKWENSNDSKILAKAKAEILKSTNDNPPALLDPFAGGGSIPLEAQRLGLEAHAHDLNPVAVMINKAMIEIPPRFAGQSPVNPDSQKLFPDKKQLQDTWKGAAGLAEDVRYYGEWMKQEAFKRIGHLYPTVTVPSDCETGLSGGGGQNMTVIAWIWARTVKCPNPACGCEMPLASSFVLSKKKGNEVWVKPVTEGSLFHFEIQYGKCPKEYESYKISRRAVFKCPCCGAITTDEYVKQKSMLHGVDSRLMAIVAEGQRGRIYVSPNAEHELAAIVNEPEGYPDGSMPANPRWFSPPAFGMTDYKDLFTNRQLTALTTFSDLVAEAQKQAEADALAAGCVKDNTPLANGGSGATAYSQAIGVYLAFIVDKMVDYHSSICIWHTTRDTMANTMRRQAIQMTWDYAEGNAFSNSTGSFSSMITWVEKVIQKLPANNVGIACQSDAQSDIGLRDIMVSTDPPYYDNIGYADLSDFFYVWLRRTLQSTYPELFRTMLVPKAEELVATPYRFDGSAEKAKQFFEEGMLKACRQLYQYAREDVPVTIYYAYKQSESDEEEKTSSSGWETMLTSIVQAGFTITGTWPMRTELTSALKGNINALASSIVLVCRKRAADAPTTTRRDFVSALKRELKPALRKLQTSNIAPVDLAQSAIGPGMGVYSRYSNVLEADGNPMSVRSALQLINQELDIYFTEQDGELDRSSRFCVELYTQYAFNDIKFGEADVLARAKNTSVEKLHGAGILHAEKGVVRLLARDEISMIPANKTQIRWDDGVIWLQTQQLTHALEQDGVVGVAQMLLDGSTSDPEYAKALAYRLYSIAERKGWAQEAFAYNSLIIAWPEIQSKAAELRVKPTQREFFENTKSPSGEQK